MVRRKPANKRRWFIVDSLLSQRRRRWFSIESTLGKRLPGSFNTGKAAQLIKKYSTFNEIEISLQVVVLNINRWSTSRDNTRYIHHQVRIQASGSPLAQFWAFGWDAGPSLSQTSVFTWREQAVNAMPAAKCPWVSAARQSQKTVY